MGTTADTRTLKTHQESVTLRQIVAVALEMGASDIHLKAARPPVIRVQDTLKFMDAPGLSEGAIMDFIDEMLSPNQMDNFIGKKDADFSVDLSDLGRFRVNWYRQNGSAALALKFVRSLAPSFDTLQLPIRSMECIASFPSGLVLVTGTRRSGKSATLAALIDRINVTRQSHIMTIEDPIEYLHPDKQCSVSQREVWVDTESFMTGFQAIMREDPNVILVSEIRDAEILQACMGAAAAGHLVFSTLHAPNVTKALAQILDMFPLAQQRQIRCQLALHLRAIVAQRLLPSAKGAGYLPAVEVMINDPGMASLIRANRIGWIPDAIADRMDGCAQTFNMDLIRLVERNMITPEAAGWL